MKNKTSYFLFLGIIIGIFEMKGQSIQHPMIWATTADKPKILDNIAKYTWAKDYKTGLETRVNTKNNIHKTNPNAILGTIPAFGRAIDLDRNAHNNMLTFANEAAMLYY